MMSYRILQCAIWLSIVLMIPVRSFAVPLSISDGDLNGVPRDQCVQRAIRALQAAGWKNVNSSRATGSIGTVYIGGENKTYTSFIACRTAGSNGSAYTVIVAAAGGNTDPMRDTLKKYMRGQQPTASTFTVRPAKAAFAVLLRFHQRPQQLVQHRQGGRAR